MATRMMKVLAQRGDATFLVAEGSRVAVVSSGNAVLATMPLNSILARGYWRPVFDEEGASRALALAQGVIVDRVEAKGGPGSGNFGHAGRPGEVGGSTIGGAPSPPSPLPKLTDRFLAKIADGLNEPGSNPYSIWKGEAMRFTPEMLREYAAHVPGGEAEANALASHIEARQAYEDARVRWENRSIGGLNPSFSKAADVMVARERERMFDDLHEDDEKPPTTQEQKDFEKDQQARLVGLMAGATPFIRVDADVLPSILGAGRFETIHSDEAQANAIAARSMEGMGVEGAEERRDEMEMAVFGAEEQPPVYGYLLDHPDGAVDGFNGHPYGTPEGKLGFYGDAAVRLNDDVKARTTFTMADSFAATMGGSTPEIGPARLDSPRLAAIGALDLTEVSSLRDVAPYVEAQYHGGVRASDIAEVILSHPESLDNAPGLKEALEVHGIPWRVSGHQPTTSEDQYQWRPPN